MLASMQDSRRVKKLATSPQSSTGRAGLSAPPRAILMDGRCTVEILRFCEHQRIFNGVCTTLVLMGLIGARHLQYHSNDLCEPPMISRSLNANLVCY